MLIPFVFALAMLGFAALGFYAGGKELRTVYHILSNDPQPVSQLHDHRGPVEIEGRAVAGDSTDSVRAPFTGSECLAYAYEVDELRSSNGRSNWHTLDSGESGVDFMIEDETGRVRVDPTGADFKLESHSVRVSPGEQVPERIESSVESTGDVDRQDSTLDLGLTELSVGNEQRFLERRIEAGDSVYVYGQATGDTESTGQWGSNLVDAVVSDGEAAPAFVVSDTGERSTAWQFGSLGLGYVVFGVLCLLLGLYSVAPL